MEDYILLAVGAILVNNILLIQYLGNCPFLGTSKSMDTAVGMAMAEFGTRRLPQIRLFRGWR